MKTTGLYITKVNDKTVLMFNGVEVANTATPDIHSIGITINGKNLCLESSIIAKSENNGELFVKLDDAMFNEVNLSKHGVAVNITKQDYELLLAGDVPTGYKKYNQFEVYNIVNDVQESDDITYSISNNTITFSTGEESEVGTDMVYQNLAEELSENTEDLTETVTNTKCPYVTIKYFNPVVEVGDPIGLEYYVDTKELDLLTTNSIDNTFTVIVTTPQGNPVKKTTYAGKFKLNTPVFNTEGETWFSIKCIDSSGVSSPVQFFNVLVVNKSQEDVVVSMADYCENNVVSFEHDGQTYNIVCDDDTTSTAIANKKAISKFLQFAKAQGATKVVFYNSGNTTYWIDYHQEDGTPLIDIHGRACGGDYITFPDNIIVDLNGSTLAATQFNDLYVGKMIEPNNNINVHIVNGTIKGCYDGFDFDTTGRNTGKTSNIAEHISVCTIDTSRYCSFEDLDISGALGYDGYISSTGVNTGTDLSFTDNKRVDLDSGEVIDANDMVVTQKISIPNSAFCIAFGRGGYCGYYNAGTEREIFASFYNGDTYLTSIKSRLYDQIVVPNNATSVIMTGYGNVYNETLNDGNSIDWRLTRPENGKLIMCCPTFSVGNVFKNCSWHDTRTTAITNPQALQTLIEGCTYSNIAKEKQISEGGHSPITPLLGDIEDSWNWGNVWCLSGCSCNKHDGSNTLLIHYIKNVDINDCSGINISSNGGVESGFIEHNSIPTMTIDINSRCYNPFVIYNDNHINRVSVNYGRNGGNYVPFVIKPAEPIVPMRNSVIDICGYADLKLRNSMNGNVWND